MNAHPPIRPDRVCAWLAATLSQYWVDWDTNSATIAREAAARAAGPTFSLIVGLCCWFAYRRQKQSSAGLPLLYLATGGFARLFGHLMSSAFTGDFSYPTTWLQLPMSVRDATSAVGAAATVAVLICVGRELRQWIPDHVGKGFGVLGVVVVPIVAGTAITVLINQPVPRYPPFLSARLSEAALGMFTLLGAVTPGTSTSGRSLQPRWADSAIFLATVLMVRLMTRGIQM